MRLCGFAFEIFSVCLLVAFFAIPRQGAQSAVYDVRAFGAKGDGQTLDTPAINEAIEAAAAAGGGTVNFPAGTYLSVSIRLRSNITLQLNPGATILAEETIPGKLTYDLPEPNEWDMYQDFGHSHWQNSLIWGIGVENVSILGPGLINGKGLTRRSPRARRVNQPGDRPVTLGGDVTTSPIFMRLGRRMRGPAGATVGKLRRVNISNIIAYNAEPRYATIIAGIPDHPIAAFLLDEVSGVDFNRVTAQRAGAVPTFLLRNVSDFNTYECRDMPNMHLDRVEQKKF